MAAEKTNFEICALYPSFVAERAASPLLGEAVSAGYGQMIDTLAERLLRDGMPFARRWKLAQVAVALLEGGSLLAQARRGRGAVSNGGEARGGGNAAWSRRGN